uniref:F-box domain-containing protein n=1 Tax=Caenorhabditis tropicalis TaxID=1561998 RepID=A0A1I7TKZ2_9PELO
MPFPLLNLPRVAYEEVLYNYSVPDLVDFSLLSSRCHRIIQSIRFPFTGVHVGVANYGGTLRCANSKWPADQWVFVKNPWRNLERKNEMRKIGGIDIRIIKLPFWRSVHEPGIQLKVVCDYLCDLFRLPITGFSFKDSNQELFPQAFGIIKCEELYLKSSSEIPVDELKYVLEKVRISNTLVLDLKKNEDFECGFVQFSMDELTINRAFWITNETFLAMDCARIVLEGNGNLPIRKFVSQWLLSKNKRFEWLKMTWNNERINWNKVFETMQWNPDIRGRNFKINSKRRVDCENGIDILRDDGLLATIIERNQQIYFLVWHKRFQPETDHLQID